MFQIDAAIERPHELDAEIEGVEIKMNRPSLQDKIVAPSYSEQTITADSPFDGLREVVVQQYPVWEGGAY